ncbi:hypothetical protein BD770DRAFT_412236 [Pilaira anomala]|nr:hypothetical protein BD770DRAFT_412236 [Pilaira anomala]
MSVLSLLYELFCQVYIARYRKYDKVVEWRAKYVWRLIFAEVKEILYLKYIKLEVAQLLRVSDRNVYNGIQEINKNDYRKALKHFEKGSSYDNEYVLLFSAIVHLIGFSSEECDLKKTMDLCKRVASDWKNPVTQYLIGCMYFEGEGVPEDKTSGVH